MSFETNRKDFENALNLLESTLSNIYYEISSADYDVIETVIREYRGHYEPDIDEVLDNLEDSLNDTLLENEDLCTQINSMEATIDELKNNIKNLNSE